MLKYEISAETPKYRTNTTIFLPFPVRSVHNKFMSLRSCRIFPCASGFSAHSCIFIRHAFPRAKSGLRAAYSGQVFQREVILEPVACSVDLGCPRYLSWIRKLKRVHAHGKFTWVDWNLLRKIRNFWLFFSNWFFFFIKLFGNRKWWAIGYAYYIIIII